MASFLFVLLAMFVLMYLLLIRPQRQQQRRHAEMLDSLKVGDEIITAGGIYGDVTGVHEDRVTVEIAEDVEIEVAKRAISNVVPPEESAEREALEETGEAEPLEETGEAEPLEEAREAEPVAQAGDAESPAPGARVADVDAREGEAARR